MRTVSYSKNPNPDCNKSYSPYSKLLQSEWSYEHWRRTHLVVRLGCARRTPLTAL